LLTRKRKKESQEKKKALFRRVKPNQSSMRWDGHCAQVLSQQHSIWLIFEIPGGKCAEAGGMIKRGGLKQLSRCASGVFSVQWRGAESPVVKELNFKQKKEPQMAEKWIQGAIKHPGALRKELHVKKGQKIPTKKLAAAAKKPGKEGKRARLAETLKKMH
jgi:hypothetical protein